MISVFLTLLAAQAAPPVAFAAPEADSVTLTDPGDGVRTLVAARTVTLLEPHTTSWHASPSPVQAGHLVVLSVDPELARPRNAWTPVLYSGDAPAEPMFTSPDATCVVAFVTSVEAPLFYGSTQLPERVDAARGAMELKAALEAGHTAKTPVTTGQPLQLTDGNALWTAAQEAASLCRQAHDHAPHPPQQ